MSRWSYVCKPAWELIINKFEKNSFHGPSKGKNDFLETKVALVWIAIHRIAKTSLSMSIFLTLNSDIWSADLLAT